MDLAGRDCGAADLSAESDLAGETRFSFPRVDAQHSRERARCRTRSHRFHRRSGTDNESILFPLWVGGLIWLFFGRVEKQQSDGEGLNVDRVIEVGRYRILGWAYVIMLVTFIVLKGKNYYLAPAYPMLFAAGAMGFERLTTREEQKAGTLGRFPFNRYPLPRFLSPGLRRAYHSRRSGTRAAFGAHPLARKLHSLSKSSGH